MKYEYITLVLTGGDRHISIHDINDINEYYKDGWEFVDSVAQTTSAAKGEGYGSLTCYGSVLFTLRKEILTL